ncbi:hypothetical protein CASFOL_029721 [Castilleja foliolosa]|uniref:Uncharacterized protein n=1 Tax=Castilleja foliolosa TaxID=1961234 RepID=A0ABD3C9C7_9LAMI
MGQWTTTLNLISISILLSYTYFALYACIRLWCFCITLGKVLLLVRCVNYSDEVYDDSSVDRPTFRWRYRNFSGEPVNHSKLSTCENELKPPGSESLPKGIVAKTSNLERRPLWGLPEKTNGSRSLFAVAVGVKQKINVDKMVRKFLESGFVVMLFHYDGIVDEWKDFGWSSKVIHVSVDNQTKWWFVKRFLHPDIVAEYNYIFLWDEDLGVENFNPQRYLSIVKEEGFEISQPALDSGKSEVHHLITTRSRRSKVHTRAYKSDGKGVQCDDTSSSPPCTGWIEVMAPVFSKSAWRCVWYMIQNDLIHAWGLDIRLGYCAQEAASQRPHAINQRIEVRRQSYNEYRVFKRRWNKAAEMDECWTDRYPDENLLNHTNAWLNM